MVFKKLVRFEEGGQIFYGDVIGNDKNEYLVKKLHGSFAVGFSATEEQIKVKKVSALTRSASRVCG